MSPHSRSALRVNLRRLRRERGWVLTELARRSGVSLPYLSQLESGARTGPRLSIVQRIATALGVPVSALYLNDPTAVELDWLSGALRTSVAALLRIPATDDPDQEGNDHAAAS